MENRELVNGLLDLIEQVSELQNELDFYQDKSSNLLDSVFKPHPITDLEYNLIKYAKQKIVHDVMKYYSCRVKINDDNTIQSFNEWLTLNTHNWDGLPEFMSKKDFICQCDKELHDVYNNEVKIARSLADGENNG